MFNVSIREYFSILNVFNVCIRNTAVFKLIPLLCTHVYLYMFSTVHPPSYLFAYVSENVFILKVLASLMAAWEELVDEEALHLSLLPQGAGDNYICVDWTQISGLRKHDTWEISK